MSCWFVNVCNVLWSLHTNVELHSLCMAKLTVFRIVMTGIINYDSYSCQEYVAIPDNNSPLLYTSLRNNNNNNTEYCLRKII